MPETAAESRAHSLIGAMFHNLKKNICGRELGLQAFNRAIGASVVYKDKFQIEIFRQKVSQVQKPFP